MPYNTELLFDAQDWYENAGGENFEHLDDQFAVRESEDITLTVSADAPLRIEEMVGYLMFLTVNGSDNATSNAAKLTVTK